tara:strand:+ start:1032 stop:1514 length:483 start_codon:yes stop_codon:yes gene_type:complete
LPPQVTTATKPSLNKKGIYCIGWRPQTGGRKRKNTLQQNYSTVSFVRCGGALSHSDLTFNFTLPCRSPALTGNHYSDYQLFLYQTISEHREQGMTFDAIADWLNKEGYLSVRGKKFRGNHVHSIVKKKRLKDEKLEREYPEKWSDFSLEVVDKTILMSDL